MDSKQWYLVQCKPRQETKAALNFSNQGIENYYPTIEVIKLVRGKRAQKMEALFPGYIFVNLDLLSLSASKVRNTIGAVGFVMFAGKPQQVPLYLFNQIKRLVIDPIDLGLQPGANIEINHGPYKGLTGRFLQYDGIARSMVLLNILNNETKIIIDNNDISEC
ncbi:transcription/translation regulatory transformer protein RfaH [Vibrio sp. SM6]|uniref:Transcription/translation regulatory transformer protein RfaH n=1 Tax=Vibrio agarilyticus TaxID=2726741 RepID=A0A7X8TRA9_9VIBR|nr:transcription/translation regulatory transformer protein RfaH [Vibrio agarilyticus]